MRELEQLSVSERTMVFADDMHYSKPIRHGRDWEIAYAEMKKILACLIILGMQISTARTVTLLELHGQQAVKAMGRYVVTLPEGKHMKFVIAGQTLLIKIVAKHAYLGAISSYTRFAHDTFQHRLRLAKGTFARLHTVLSNRSVPLQLRLQLWQGCVYLIAQVSLKRISRFG